MNVVLRRKADRLCPLYHHRYPTAGKDQAIVGDLMLTDCKDSTLPKRFRSARSASTTAHHPIRLTHSINKHSANSFDRSNNSNWKVR